MATSNTDILNIENMCTYIGKTEIVKRASFSVKPAEIIGLIGPNGAGKTTIMKTILGLTKFSGKVEVDGLAVSENNHEALQKVGALIEHPAIYPFLTGRENLNLYAKDKDDLGEIVATLRMNSYIDSKSKGYSLGMKQKLGIAIALLNHPKLIILDEPMNGLDVESTIVVRKIIQDYANRGTAFLISSHILSELEKVMTKVVLISGGEIIVNQDVTEFNRISRQKYKLITENNDKAMAIFSKNQINFKKENNFFLISQNDIFQIQDLLYQNRIHLKEMLPVETNFEEIVINILNKEEANNEKCTKTRNI